MKWRQTGCIFSISASRTDDGFIRGAYMPLNDRAAGGLELGITYRLFAFMSALS